MNYKFVNEQHEQQYHDARALLKSEDERQESEANRLMTEWQRLPHEERAEKMMWLRRHFHECRAPYVKLLGEILALASPIITIPADGPSVAKEEK